MPSEKYRSVKESIQLFLPPVVGFSFFHLIKLLFKYGISFKYVLRILAILIICVIGIPFRTYEHWRYRRKIKNFQLTATPIFIIGHWRSGTTHLHNIICQDPKMGYVTTFQSVFPENVFPGFGRWLFKSFMKLLIPTSRKGDNVKLGVEYPQEEEFVLGRNHDNSFYDMWYFPRKTMYFFDKYLLGMGATAKNKANFRHDYYRMIKKAMINLNRTWFISKNPPNTARVPALLEIFPNAKFIHIYRNPVMVLLSTRHFFSKIMPPLQMHTISDEDRNEMIYELYKKTMDSYFRNAPLIPKENLVEVRFEEFDHDPLGTIQRVYEDLNISGFEESKARFEVYVDSKKDYKKNTYKIDRKLFEEIQENCRFSMEKLNYDLPSNVEIIDD